MPIFQSTDLPNRAARAANLMKFTRSLPLFPLNLSIFAALAALYFNSQPRLLLDLNDVTLSGIAFWSLRK